MLNNKRALIAGIFGALSTIPGEVITRILVSLGIGKYDEYQLNSLVATINEPSVIIGMIINFIIGSLIGVLLYLLIEKTGKELTICKSIFLGLLIWFIFESSFTAFYEGLLHVQREANDHYVHLVGTTIYGLSQGLLFRYVLYRVKINSGKA
jgi:hypothetical protein